MTALAHLFEPSQTGSVASTDLADLARIYEPGVNQCPIHRRPGELLQRFVAELRIGRMTS
ncbi:MAG: hypothetical protein AB1648_02055 [Pseudomonadota bacterium]